MMNANVKWVTRQDPKAVCRFCHTSIVKDLEWGKLYQLNEISVHYFCLLFAAGLGQNGKGDEGIMGFLPADILKEVKRGTKLKCKYCRKPNATIGCSVPKCKTSFHYPCGLKNECGFQFIDNYEAYCPKHKEKNGIPQDINLELDLCPICFCGISKEDSHSVWPPCCRKGVLLHKSCVMEMGRSHGLHFFKCPLCNDKEIFSVAMRKAGIYLPNRDAAWEADPGAFEEHLQQYKRCDAEKCSCPQGRDHSSETESEPWTIIRCGGCGASAIHKFCGKLKNLTWSCVTCAEILSNKRKSREMNTARTQQPHYETLTVSSDEQGLSSDNSDEGASSEGEDIACKHPSTVDLIRCDGLIPTYVTPPADTMMGNDENLGDCEQSSNSRVKSMGRNTEAENNSPRKRKRSSPSIKKCRYGWVFRNLKKRPTIIPAVKTTAEMEPDPENNLAKVVPPNQNQAEAALFSEAQNRTEADDGQQHQKNFRCPFCFVTFMGPALLIAHLPNHSADLDKLRNPVSPNGQTHSEKEVNVEDLPTTHEDSEAMDDGSLLNPAQPHVKLRSEEGRPFKCSKCNFTFTTIQSLRIHECSFRKRQSYKYSAVILRDWKNYA